MPISKPILSDCKTSHLSLKKMLRILITVCCLEPSLKKKVLFFTKILKVIDIGKIGRKKREQKWILFSKLEGRVTGVIVSRPLWDFPHQRSDFELNW